MNEIDREEALMGFFMLIIASMLLVWLCLIPSRHSDGRIPEEIAREMYHAEWDIPVFDRSDWNDK
jgi:hypothetical protein